MTREEWRALGFFYDRDDSDKCWRLTGSKTGLGRFASSLHAYCEDTRSDTLSEHDHLGPHMYLKIMTWSVAGVDRKSIHGTREDLRRLATLTQTLLGDASAGDKIDLGKEYVADAEYDLLLVVEHEGFDPSTADQALT